ncbi:FecR family protein [Sunxiuqinia sp. A32]|uniref:FecR family protein n=1 Tax=Sunxiuqinia sp. A32 TaxID=3461496 RepID=UPI00404530B9
MQRDKYIVFNTTEEFIHDNEFVLWVLNPDRELDEFWSSFIQDYPEKIKYIKDAALIIKSIQPIESEVSEKRLNEIFQKVLLSDKPIKRRYYFGLKYAAGIIVLCAIGSLIWLSVNLTHQFPIEADNGSVRKGKIILANGSTREFDTEQTTIRQISTGKLTINNDTLEEKSNKPSAAMNQIIIPYGKRTDVVLADGTHIWLNSGSQLSYPEEFKPDSREVYLSGEAFFEVKSNPDKPFYVVTRDIKIKVFGTSFNVTSYEEDKTIETVLVEGKISAGRNKLFAKSINLTPGERMTYDKKNENLSTDKVDVRMYSSWVNGYLIFQNVPLVEIFKKLERFYNKEIRVETDLGRITFSGKLDLKDDIEDVLDNISFTSAVKVFRTNGLYIIKK